MIITPLSLHLKVYSCKPEHIVPRTCSPLNLLDFHPLNLLIHISHKKELRFMNSSPKDHPFILRSTLLSPIQCMSAIGVFPRIYLGFLIEYSPPPIGFAPTIVSGTVALDSSQKNLALLRRRSQLHLRVHRVSCREMRYCHIINSSFKCTLLTGCPGPADQLPFALTPFLVTTVSPLCLAHYQILGPTSFHIPSTETQDRRF
jgi:hypothetical protein